MSQSSNVKLCECGCGKPTSIARATNETYGHVRGKPVRFIPGHHNIDRDRIRELRKERERERIASGVAWGLCLCGCGEPTARSKQTDFRAKYISGYPQRYRVGHSMRGSAIPYVVEDRGYISPCWIWQRAVNNMGYGMGYIDGHLKLAHRLYYELANGSIPTRHGLDHLCISRTNGTGGSTRCVNPDHLEPTTQQENVRRGVNTKLTVLQVREIRALLAAKELNQKQIASMYGVASETINGIHKRRSWKNV